MASSRLSLTFRIFKDDQLVREETLAQGVIKIGKVPSAHLRIDDESVSRMHAIVEVANAEAQIIDLGSTRGTFINGHRINKARLRDGDSIALGDTRVDVAIGDAVAAIHAVRTSDRAPARPAGTQPPPDGTAPPRVTPPVVRSIAPAAPPARPVAIPAAATVPVAMPAVPAAMPVIPAGRAVVAAPMPTMPFAAPPPAPAAFQAAMAESIDDAGGARAVEVAAMLGDSVVNVKHCIDPRGGKVTSATWGLLAGGVACLAASTVAFYVAVDTAASNQRMLERQTRVEHKPAAAFRPRIASPAVDAVAFGGLALGLLGLTFALARARTERKSPYFRIGTAPGVEQPVEHAPADSFPLVAPSGDDFVFNYGAGMHGELIVDGTTTPLAELVAAGRARPSTTTAGAIEIPIPPKARIRATAGQTTFVVSAVARPRRHAAPLLASLDSRALKYVAGSLAVHLGIWLVLQQIPVEDGGIAIELNELEHTWMVSTSTMNDDVPPPPEQGDPGSGDPGAENTTTAMKLDEGAAGDPKNPEQDGHIRIKDNHAPEPQLSRDEAIAQARDAGFLGSASVLQENITSLTAQANFSSGFDDQNVYGPLDGSDGPGHGNFGMGKRGFGPGGGCAIEPCGLIGTGKTYHGLIGTGKYAGDGYWAGGGGGHMRNHTATPPGVRISDASAVTDGLDKAIIRRYVRRAIDRIGYCYEHELLAHPTIEGTVTVQFLIAPTGAVTSAVGTGFDPAVSSCVAGVVKAIQFPKPTNNGNVQVNYPFTFRAQH